MVKAEVDGWRATRTVLVLPAGTFRLTGFIADADTGALLPGARVEARIDANGSSPPIVVATAGLDGKYSLYGVPALSYVRVTHDRYVSVNERVDLTAHGTRHFIIAFDTALYGLAGSYTLTIEADAACPSAPSPLPPGLRLRTFPAQIEHAGSRLTVHVTCAAVGACGEFAGSASTSGALFQLMTRDEFGIEVEDFVECIRLDPLPCQALVFLGTATTSFSATGLVGNLDGTMTYYPVEPGGRRPSTAACRAGRFELTRR